MSPNEEFARHLALRAWFPDDENLSLIIEDIGEVFTDRMMSRIVSKLADEALVAKLESLEDAHLIDKFLENHIDDFEWFMGTIYNEFEDQYIGAFEQAAEEKMKQ